MFTGSEDEKLLIGETSEDDITKNLSNLDPNKTTGADKLSTQLLRECQELVLPPKLLFNRSLQENTLTSYWICANANFQER